MSHFSEAIDFHVKVAFIHGFKADIVISRVGPYGVHIFKKNLMWPDLPQVGQIGPLLTSFAYSSRCSQHNPKFFARIPRAKLGFDLIT